MTAKSEKKYLQQHAKFFRQKLKNTIFPRIVDHEKLFCDKYLKPIRLISTKNVFAHSREEIKIHFELNIYGSLGDVYLYLNGNKSDMFYSISSGKYHFNVHLENKKNDIEMYYILNGCKSLSVYKTIMRK